MQTTPARKKSWSSKNIWNFTHTKSLFRL